MNPQEYLDALLSLPSIDDYFWPQVSPDGRWAAWSWYNVGPVADVFVVPTDGSTAPVQLTDTDQNTLSRLLDAGQRSRDRRAGPGWERARATLSRRSIFLPVRCTR
jgi:hypothetical protein